MNINKKFIYILTIISMLCSAIFAFAYFGTVKTFFNTSVYHIHRDQTEPELSKSEKNEYELEAYSRGAVAIVSEATITYNCHGYAWAHEQENCWIGVNSITDENIFWEDGGFSKIDDDNITHIEDPDYATHVSYLGDDVRSDHSARQIMYNGQRMFISKWGSWPLVIHPIGDDPYTQYATGYAYYHLNMGVNISGPGSITNGESAEWSVEVNSPHANPPYTYVWKIKEEAGNWTEISTSSSLNSNDFSHSDDFELKVIATDSKGWFSCSEYKNITVTDPPPPPQLSVSIFGPPSINADYEYPSWTAIVTDGSGSYSYQWSRSDIGVVSDLTYYMPDYIETGNDFDLTVKVTDNNTNSTASYTAKIYVTVREISIDHSNNGGISSIYGGVPFSNTTSYGLHYSVEWYFTLVYSDGSYEYYDISNDPNEDINSLINECFYYYGTSRVDVNLIVYDARNGNGKSIINTYSHPVGEEGGGGGGNFIVEMSHITEDLNYSIFRADVSGGTPPYTYRWSATDLDGDFYWSEEFISDNNFHEIYGIFFPSSDGHTYLIEVEVIDNNNVSSTDSYNYTYYDDGGGGNQKPSTVRIPKDFTLEQNYPNPFNPVTTIQFALPKSSPVKLGIYDITGREVAVLVNGSLPAGYHSVQWDARNVSSGMYIYRITAGSFTQTKRMTIIK